MAHIISFTEAATIALHGMVLIARSKETTNVIKIAQATGSSRHHVAKVMQRLVKEGYLGSQRGPSGGFTLKMPPEKISFLDIYEGIEGKIEIGKCPLDHLICAFEKCLFNNITRRMTEEFVDYMRHETLDKYI